MNIFTLTFFFIRTNKFIRIFLYTKSELTTIYNSDTFTSLEVFKIKWLARQYHLSASK